MGQLPSDNVMLLSFVNMKLRDFYQGDLEAMCEDLDVSKSEIIDRLASIDYVFDENEKRFV